MNKDLLKSSILELLKEDEGFRKSVITLIQEDLFNQVDFNLNYETSSVLSRSQGYGDETETDVVSSINDIEVKFINFDSEKE